MSFKFFNDRIKTSDISLEDAVKKAQSVKPQEVPSLDDLLSRLDAENKGVKTASSSEKETKTADTKAAEQQEEPKVSVQVHVDEELTKEAQNDEAKQAEHKSETDVKAESDQKQTKQAMCECRHGDDCECPSDCPDCDCNKEQEEGCEASASKPTQMKIAKRIDFRNWEAEDVVKAWGQHGSIKACEKNVSSLTDNPRLYCGLLQTASGMAKNKLEKLAAAKKGKEKKQASAEKPAKAIWKKLAKLTEKERAMLDKYWRKLYGDYYVDAMLSDY